MNASTARTRASRSAGGSPSSSRCVSEAAREELLSAARIRPPFIISRVRSISSSENPSLRAAASSSASVAMARPALPGSAPNCTLKTNPDAQRSMFVEME